MNGGINILKQYVAGIEGEIIAYVLITNEDKCIFRENLKGTKKKKVKKRKADYELGEDVRISVDRETVDPKFIGKHRPPISGPLNKQVDNEKWKQTSINEGEKRKRKELAHNYVAM